MKPPPPALLRSASAAHSRFSSFYLRLDLRPAHTVISHEAVHIVLFLCSQNIPYYQKMKLFSNTFVVY